MIYKTHVVGFAQKILQMSGIDKGQPIVLKWKDDIFSTKRGPSFIAVVGESNKSVIEIFDHDGNHLHSLALPGFGSEDCHAAVTFAWSSSGRLAVASSAGHVLLWTLSETTAVPSSILVPVGKVTNSRFLQIQFSKSGDLLFVLSGTEVVVFASVGAGSGSYEYLKTVSYIEGSPDTPLCLSVHPSDSVVAICSAARRSVLLVATGTGSATTADFKTNLRKKPKLDDDETKSPIENDDMDSSFALPSIVNEIKMATGRQWPVSAKWSKYGETLVIGSSDNLLSIWNIPSAQLETVSLGGSEVVIRNVSFVDDVFVVVSINDPERILIVNIDEGILYDSQEESQFENPNIQPGSATRCASLDHYVEKKYFVITRPLGDMTLVQWKLSL